MVSGRSPTDTSTQVGSTEADLSAQEKSPTNRITQARASVRGRQNTSDQKRTINITASQASGAVGNVDEALTVEEKARAGSGIKLPTAIGTRGEPAKLMRAMTGIRGIAHARMMMNRILFYSIIATGKSTWK